MITRRAFLTTLALIPTVAQIPLQAAPEAAGSTNEAIQAQYRTHLHRSASRAELRQWQRWYDAHYQVVVYHGWD